MLTIKVGNVITELAGGAPRWALDPVTSFKIHGRWFAKKWRQGMWDGQYRFIRKMGGSEWVPTGLLERVCARLDEIGYPYQLFDERELFSPDPVYELNGASLTSGKWSFQAPVLDAALMKGRGVIHVPTGGGKTVIAAGVLASFDLPSLFLTHRQQLLHQTRERFENLLQQPVGIIGDGIWEPARITVAMVQTLARKRSKKESAAHWSHFVKKRAEFLNTRQMLIADEVHHLESKQWWELLNKIDTSYRFGLTATPCFHGSGMRLIAHCGEIVAAIDRVDLIERGVLVQPKLWYVRERETDVSDGEWAAVYRDGIVENVNRNNLVYLVASTFAHEKKNSITLVRQIKHGRLLERLFTNRGLRCEFLYGKIPMEERRLVLGRLRDGKVDNVIAMDAIMSEGVDIPWLRTIINATGSRGGGSAGNSVEHETGRVTLQILGRILRAAPRKLDCEYVDFSDRSHPWLKRNSLQRAHALQENGYGPWMRHWEERTSLAVA